MDAATAAAANAHPSQKFAIVDDAPKVKGGTHVSSLQYETDQAGFLGGILAAGMSKTGTVATYGGQPFPSVTLYMNGFVAGVRYYDKTYSKSVKVLGWTPAAGACSLSTCNGKGTFVGNFTDQTAGKTDTTTFFSQKADIVFPVAGSVGLGSIAAAKLAGVGHSVMWVDSNGCISDKADCKWFVGTVAKGVEPSVAAAVLSAAKGTFKAGTYVGTLANKGTALEYGGVKVPSALKAKIATAKAGIIAGTISVNPNKYPAK
jgi:basic membrane protein A